MIPTTESSVLATPEYQRFIEDLKARVVSARISAARAANRDLSLLYWDLGGGIVEKQHVLGWGESVVEMVSADLRRAFPGMRGFSSFNLWRMRRLYLEYSSPEFLAQAVPGLKKPEREFLVPDGKEPLAFSGVVRAARQRDKLTLQILEAAAQMLGWAVAELALALNPSRIILAGLLPLLGDILLQPIQKRAEEILQGSGADVPAIVNSTMGEYSGALGAAALAVHEWKPTR